MKEVIELKQHHLYGRKKIAEKLSIDCTLRTKGQGVFYCIGFSEKCSECDVLEYNSSLKQVLTRYLVTGKLE